MLLLVVDHLIVQVDNLRALQPMDVSWVPAVEARPDATFAVSWISNSVSAFTGTWAVGIMPGLEREVSSRITAGRPLFALSDYLLFGEHDAAEHPDLYTRRTSGSTSRPISAYRSTVPCRAVAPTSDRAFPVDRPRPTRSDVEVAPLRVSATRVRPGDCLLLGGEVANNGGRQFQAELLQRGAPIAEATFNCQAGAFIGEYQIPANTPPGPQAFGARLVAPDGRIVSAGEVQIDVAADAPPPARRIGSPTGQPTAHELIALNPTLPIADRGREYVIFDLRGLYRDR